MKIIHCFGDNRITKEITGPESDPSLMLGRGVSYLWTGASPASRYQGWFFGFGGNSIIKILDDIRPRGRGQVTALTNNFARARKSSNEFEETFFLTGRESMVYELDKAGEIEIFFDIKDPYQCPEFGRNYKVSEEDHMIVVEFDQEEGFSLPKLFVAICGDFSEVKLEEEWVKTDYRFDRARGSQPSERWVFKPGIIRAQKIIIAAGTTKEGSLKSARAAWRESGKIKNRIREIPIGSGLAEVPGGGEDAAVEVGMAWESAVNALRILYSQKDGQIALRAGLPWFFQIWRRDEAVSLKGLAQCDRGVARAIFWRQIRELSAAGYRYTDSADAVGWLFLRAAEFIRQGWLIPEEKQKVSRVLEKTIENLLTQDTGGEFAVNGDKFTWMDSLSRAGAAVEIQALRLNMYSLAASLVIDAAKKQSYLDLEEKLATAVKKMFFDGKRLADNFDVAVNRADFRSRPNIFLAAYAYPDLLKEGEWAACFDWALSKLWLDWGGLATLDKSDPQSHARDTGEDSAAYHNGDSWFWVNNIAAIVMARFDQGKYKQYIDKIFAASQDDILWNGAVGCPSEISSAELYRPAGCLNQAWSGATFLELCAALKR